MLYLIRIIAFTAVALLTACGGGGGPLPAAQAQPPAPLIGAFGDSLTACYMAHDGARLQLVPELCYLRELRAIGPVRTAAVGGASTADARANQLHWLEPLRLDVVVILLGTNDAVRNLPREAALANVDAIVTRWPLAKVVIVSPPRWDAASDPWMSAWSRDLSGLAQRRGAEFVDAYAASQAENWQCSIEDFHPCEQGHRRMGAMVSGAVRHALTKF